MRIGRTEYVFVPYEKTVTVDNIKLSTEIMTKYRTESDGFSDYLQYEKIKVTNYYFFKTTKVTWEYVWKPQYDKIFGRSGVDSDLYVNSYDNLDKFIIKWPNIDDYFVHANKEQSKLINKANQWRDELEAKKGNIEYL